MSSLEGNKIIAAILVGGMITLSAGIVTNFIYRPGHGGGEGEHQASGAPAQPKAVEPILGLLANADIAKGETIAKKCLTCHVFEASGENKVGPGLWGVIGRAAGTHEGFAYSEAMKSSGKTWSYAELNHFLANPKAAVPGTKMSFVGLPKAEDRANIIAWLRTKADSEPALPTPEEIAAEATPATAAPAAEEAAGSQAAPAQNETAAAPPPADPMAMIASADPAQGAKVAKKCLTCHSLDKDGPNKIGPALWGVVGRAAGTHEGFAYSDAMKNSGKTWSLQELDAYLTEPKAVVPGNKMSFVGVKKPEERAALLRWLRDQSDNPVPLP
jgi:cytochrome c